jgi:hypothetical protein
LSEGRSKGREGGGRNERRNETGRNLDVRIEGIYKGELVLGFSSEPEAFRA